MFGVLVLCTYEWADGSVDQRLKDWPQPAPEFEPQGESYAAVHTEVGMALAHYQRVA